MIIYIKETMPYGKSSRKTKRTKKASKGGRKRTRKARLPRYNMGMVSGMPNVRKVSMRYVEEVSLTSTSGILTLHLFRANSVFDPNQTGTGHQPMGYDQMGTLYNHYVVLGAKITVHQLRTNTTAVLSQAIGIYLDDDTSTHTDYTGFIESKKGQTKVSVSTNAQSGANVVRGWYSPKKFFNIKDVKDNWTRIGASVGNNPAEEAFFYLWYKTCDGSTSACNFLVQIDYIVEFAEPKTLGQS